MLEIAALLCLLIGLIHSCLGERFILIRLFRSGAIPHLFGSDHFTKQTLRFAWHLTTIAWWGFAYLLLKASDAGSDFSTVVLNTTALVFLVSGAFSFGFTKGKHLSWVVFWGISAMAYYSAINS